MTQRYGSAICEHYTTSAMSGASTTNQPFMSTLLKSPFVLFILRTYVRCAARLVHGLVIILSGSLFLSQQQPMNLFVTCQSGVVSFFGTELSADFDMKRSVH